MSSTGGHLVIGARLARRLEGLAWVSIVGTVFFILAVIALHFLRPEYNPVTRVVSELAIGPYGYLLTIGFLALAVGGFALALGIRQGVASSRAKNAGSLLLAVWPIGFVVSAIFPTDLQGSPVTTHGTIHNAAGLISFIVLIAAIFLNSLGFRRDATWRAYYPASLVLGFAALATFLLFPISMSGGWGGIGQRAFITAFLLWLLSTENRLLATARAMVPAETSARSVE